MSLQWYKKNIYLYHKVLEHAEQFLKNLIIFGYKDNNELSLIGRLDIEGIIETILIVYPLNYPYSPPKVWILDDNKLDFKSFEKAIHQNIDNSLCLFTSDWGEGSWHFNMDLNTLLDKLKVSIMKIRKSEHTDEHSSIVISIPGKNLNDFEVYLPTEILEKILQDSKNHDSLELFEYSNNLQGRILKYPSKNNILEEIFVEGYWKSFKPLKSPIKGCYIKFHFKKDGFRNQIEKFGNLKSLIEDYGVDIAKISFIFPLFEDSKVPDSSTKDPKEFDNIISYLYLINNIDISNIFKIPLYKVFSVKLPDDIFQRTNAIFDKMVENLHNSKVLVLGLGTLGSFITMELVKSGIGKIILYDFDIFQTVNICRHIGDISDVGKYKADIIEERIKLYNPGIDVQKRVQNPFERTSNLLKFLEDIKNVDLIIDTTASYQANLQLNNICIENDKNVIYAWCGPNAECGRIFRVIPRKSPCYYCINLQLEKEPEKFPRIKKQFEGYQVPQFVGYRQPGIPGISIDINFIGLFVSRLSIQTLLKDEIGYSDSYSNHYIWQNKPTELDPFLEIGIIPMGDFRINKKCPFCKPQSKLMFNIQKKNDIERILKKTIKNFKKYKF